MKTGLVRLTSDDHALRIMNLCSSHTSNVITDETEYKLSLGDNILRKTLNEPISEVVS